MTLKWIENPNYKTYIAVSESQINGTLRIFYDDVMYWPSWSPDCTQDLDALKQEAQEIHDQWVRLSMLSS
jgi:hypothetical protein